MIAPAQTISTHQKPFFENFIVIRNPVSTNAHNCEKYIHEIKESYPISEIIVIDTKKGGQKTNVKYLRKYSRILSHKTLICVAGGDGTVNMVVSILLLEKSLPPEARFATVLPLWGGNANDLAYMLNSAAAKRPLSYVLDHAKQIAIRPMICKLHLANEKELTYMAVCYASFGATAFAAQEIERTFRRDPPVRQGAASRLGQEFITVSRAILGSSEFAISEAGNNKQIFERMLLNGPRFAKVFGVPANLTEGRFHQATVEHKSLPAILFHIAGLTGVSKNHTQVTRDIFTVRDAIWAQFDGEAVRIPKNTRIEVSVSIEPFYALSMK